MTTENVNKAAPEMTKSTSSQKPSPIRVFRKGAVAASVWQRQTGTGFAYYDFSLSRSWKSSASGREGYSTSFFPQNADALAEVIQQAADWIAEEMPEASEPARESSPKMHKAA